MAKSYIVFTSPVNEYLAKDCAESFYKGLKDVFKCDFSKSNTGISCDARMSSDKLHIFEDDLYLGFITLMDEEDYVEKVSTTH